VVKLRAACIRDHRSVRWWLWPGADQVLRRTVLEHGCSVLLEQEAAADLETARWVQLLDRTDAPEIVGAVMANSPEAAARCTIDEDPLSWIEHAQGRVVDVRKQRQHG
jgi:hypothetical protein